MPIGPLPYPWSWTLNIKNSEPNKPFLFKSWLPQVI